MSKTRGCAFRFVKQQRAFRRAFAHSAEITNFTKPRAEQQTECFLILKLRHIEAEQISRAENLFVITTTVSVFPTPLDRAKRKLPRGRPGFVSPSSPRRTADVIRGSAWDWPRISRGNRAVSSWSLVSFVESVVLSIPDP